MQANIFQRRLLTGALLVWRWDIMRRRSLFRFFARRYQLTLSPYLLASFFSYSRRVKGCSTQIDGLRWLGHIDAPASSGRWTAKKLRIWLGPPPFSYFWLEKKARSMKGTTEHDRHIVVSRRLKCFGVLSFAFKGSLIRMLSVQEIDVDLWEKWAGIQAIY